MNLSSVLPLSSTVLALVVVVAAAAAVFGARTRTICYSHKGGREREKYITTEAGD
jgi:hypothetical protein